MSTDTQADELLTDVAVDALNMARSILKAYAEACATKGWYAPSGFNDGDANAVDYGRVSALAVVADDAIFTVLNWSNAHAVSPLTDAQIRNQPVVPDAA